VSTGAPTRIAGRSTRPHREWTDNLAWDEVGSCLDSTSMDGFDNGFLSGAKGSPGAQTDARRSASEELGKGWEVDHGSPMVHR
jgi:hypothetical protein